MPTPTTLTILTLVHQFTSINGQTAEFYFEGYLKDNVGVGVPGKTISLEWQEDDLSWVSLGVAITDAVGWYGKLVQVFFGIRDIRSAFAGDGAYDPSNAQKTLIITGLGEQQLRALFWVTHYPKPEDIEPDVYGYVLCIDPNGARKQQPIGPLFLLLDKATIKPGFTDRNGSVAAFLNDNEAHVSGGPWDGELKHWDMYLLRTNTPYIRDNDEFWIGVQRGPDVPPSDDPENDVWDSSGGLDGKGAGRRWILGGYISKRYYTYTKDTRITAVIRGKDYMDVWRSQPFGTPDIPRNYTSATDFATVAANVLTDVNITSGLTFTSDPDWWPGAGIVPIITGVEWVKEFKREWSFDVMQKGCEEAGWEWQIDFKKEILLYPRFSGPVVAQPLIEFHRNIRELPEICIGDTSELITNIIVTDGDSVTLPSEIDGWCRNPKDFPDIGNPNMTFSVIEFPAPPNIHTGTFADQSLTLDDQGHPALCFMKDTVYQFNLALSFFSDAAGNPIFATLNIDLRKWRRERLRFRHATRQSAYEYGGASFTTGTTYRLLIMNDLGHGYYYDFGKGTVNPGNRSPQLVNGQTDHDYVTGTGWNEIELLLPEADIDGVVSNANLKGWVRIGGYTGSTINWIEVSVYAAEPNPGPYGPSLILGGNIVVGDNYITINAPEQIAGYSPGGAGTQQITLTRSVEIILRQGATEEILSVIGIKGSSYPAGKNVWLQGAAQNNFTAGVATINIRAGWTISFSQLRLERNLTYEQDAISPLAPPYRYKMVTKKEMEYLSEAESQASMELAQDSSPRQYVRASVDGDPRITIGYRMLIRLDPGHSAVFQNIPMIIDDIEYGLEDQVDFSLTLLLAPSNERARVRTLSEATALDVLFRKTQNLAQGKTPLTRGVT